MHAYEADLTNISDIDEGDGPENGQMGHATGANGGVPMSGGTTKAVEGDATLESDSEDAIIPVRSGRRARVAPIILSSEEDSDIQAAQGPVTPKKRLRTHQDLLSHTSTLSYRTDTDPPTRKWRQKLSVSPESQPNANQSTPESSRMDGHNTKETPKSLVTSNGIQEDSSEDDVVTPARRRRNTANVGSSPQKELSEREEVQELDDDVADLSDTGECILSNDVLYPQIMTTSDGFELKLTPLFMVVLRKTRTRGKQDNSERSKRQRKLKELRQRRAGIRAESDDEGEDSAEDGSESGPDPIHHAMRRGGNLDEYEDDFMDDEDDTVGVDLGVAGVPLKFTYHANKKPFDNFKTEVEWMVHNKLNPAFERHDEIYLLAHEKLDHEIQQLGNAKFSSSVWKEPFVRALRSKPDCYRVDVPLMLEHKCDACQRSNHPPKHKVTFTGKPYNRATLETVEYEDDGEEDDSHESSESDDEENFFLGR